jgi:hypothetical protein
VTERAGTATELSEAWFSLTRSGQERTLGAARRFVDLVDVVLPLQGGDDSRRRQVIDGAFERADRAGAAQLDVMRSALQNTVLVYFDVDVGVAVDTAVKAFNGNDVDVTVPTDVGFLNRRGSARA